MLPLPVPVQPSVSLPVLARLYGCGEQDLADLAGQLTAAWLLEDQDGTTLGLVGLRPSPAHGAELVGGAFPGPMQDAVARALIQTALAAQPRVYAYAEAHLWPVHSLEVVGLIEVAAYTRMVGLVPDLQPVVPEGFTVVPLSEVGDPSLRWAAQQTYSDRIGHTVVPPQAAQPDFGGSDDTLSRMAFGAAGEPVGICRASLEGKVLTFGTPGVRADARGTGLRMALTLSVCQAARARGAHSVVVEGWGDTSEELAEDTALGWNLEAATPIFSSVPR